MPMKPFFERSEEGLNEQLNECLHIIEISLMLADTLGITAFYKVIAAQLRILLSDTLKDHDSGEIRNNSLILKVMDDVKLARVKKNVVFVDQEEDEVIDPRDLFDFKAKGVALDVWLKQKVFQLDKERPITIEKLIKFYSNKHGGTHIDESIHGQALLIGVLGDAYLSGISRYVLKYFNRELTEMDGDMLEQLKLVLVQ